MATVKPTIKEIEEWQAGLNGTAAYDVISKPKHYMLFEDKNIEVRDVIKVLVLKLNDGFLAGKCPEGNHAPLFDSDYVQLMQYLMRFMDKNGVEDLKKARWYLDKMIESY
jgi:hypothetical protein